MCVLCSLNPVNAIDGTHETLAGADVPAHLQFEALSETLRAFLTQVENRFPILDWDGFLDKAGWLAGEIGWGGLPAGPGTGSQLPENELVGAAIFSQSLSAPGGAGTLQTLADYLTTGFWDDFWGQGTQHKFNLTDTGVNAKDGVLYYDLDGFSGIDGGDTNGIAADRQQYIRDILDVYGDLLGITFIEATNASGIEADLYFKDNYLGAAYANSEFDAATGYIEYSYVNVGSDWSGGTETIDDYTLQTFFHEIGHALGLGHQGLYNAGSGTPTYNDATWANDTWNYTMMSYWEQAYYGDATSAYLFGPKVVDLIALDDLYADQGYGTQNAFTGNTTYGFNTTISNGQNWLWSQLSTYADQMSFTIADGAGIDTVDFSGYSDDQLIDLRASDPSATSLFSSNIGGLIGNMSIAAGTIIENAVGGSGDDTFIGNEYGNVLTGNNGNDTFTGNGGDDEFYGGIGDDLVTYAASIGNYSVTVLTDFLQIVGEGIDLVFDDIEFFLFGTATYTYSEVMAYANGNAFPIAGDDTAATLESQPVGFNVLDNDSDPDGDDVTLVSVEGEDDGSVTLSSGAVVTFSTDGNVTYDPNGAFDDLFTGQSATDSFSYEVSDGLGGTDTATVEVTVNGQGSQPVDTDVLIDFEDASTGTYSGEAGLDVSGLSVVSSTTLNGSAYAQTGSSGDFSIVSDDGSFELDSMVLRAQRRTTDVTISGYSNGVLVATETLSVGGRSATTVNFGSDFADVDEIVVNGSRRLYVDDIAVVTTEAGVSNTPPVARNDAFATGEASSVNGNLFADNGSGADSDADFDALELVSVNGDGDGFATLASGATVTFADNGTFSYDPNGAFDFLNDGQSDTDSFTYLVSDGQGGTDTAIATVTINGSGTAPVDPTDPITIDFEDEPTGTFSGVDGLDFSGLSVASTTRLNGSKAGQTGSSGDFSIVATDGDFDLDSLTVRSGFTRSTVQVEISAYDDGVLVGTETVTLSRSGNDIDFGSDFDSIDQVIFSSSTRIYVDDLDFIV